MEKEIECYILFLNSKNNFKKEQKNFYGSNAFNEAIEWGRKNLENFIIDMIHFT